MEDRTHTIQLAIGYKESNGEIHKSVTFGKRLDGAGLFQIEADPQSSIQTQYNLMLIGRSITSFGALPMPVPLACLLSLDLLDLSHLTQAYLEFTSQGLEGRESKIISDTEVMLAFGYSNNGLTYNRVRFGNRVTGYDAVSADTQNLKGELRECYLIGKEISELSTEDGAHKLTGPIEAQLFEKLDNADIVTLQKAAVRWRGSFLKSRRSTQEDGAPGSTPETAHGADGS